MPNPSPFGPANLGLCAVCGGGCSGEFAANLSLLCQREEERERAGFHIWPVLVSIVGIGPRSWQFSWHVTENWRPPHPPPPSLGCSMWMMPNSTNPTAYPSIHGDIMSKSGPLHTDAPRRDLTVSGNSRERLVTCIVILSKTLR